MVFDVMSLKIFMKNKLNHFISLPGFDSLEILPPNYSVKFLKKKITEDFGNVFKATKSNAFIPGIKLSKMKSAA